MKAVSNTTPLCYLIAIKQEHLLGKLFEKVFVPVQNGIAGRWVESCRRDLLDQVIAMNEAHLKRLLSEHRYFQEDRTHLGLTKETPGRRVRAAALGGVTTLPKLGGRRYRYERVAQLIEFEFSRKASAHPAGSSPPVRPVGSISCAEAT